MRSRWLSAQLIALTIVGLYGCLPARLEDEVIAEKIANAKAAVDCLSVAACTGDCKGDETCVTACSAGATPATLQAHQALRSCVDTCGKDLERGGAPPCVDPGSESCKRTCRAHVCRTQLIACADNGTYGDSNCIAGGACLDACGDRTEGDGLNCGHECIRPLAEIDSAALAKVSACYGGVDLSGLSDRAARHKALQTCSGELAACYARGVSGAETCVTGMGCMDPCTTASDAESCYTQCATTLSSGAQADFVSLLYCLTTANPGSLGAIVACSWAVTACAGPKAGGATCSEMQSTFQGCLAKQPGALFGCVGDAVANGRLLATKPFLDFNVCANDACAKQCGAGKPAAGCAACAKLKCLKEWTACGFGK